LLFGHAGGGNAQTEKAGIEALQFRFNAGIVKQVWLNNFVKLRMLYSGSRPSNRLDRLNVRIEQAFPKDALADHARTSEDQYPHIGPVFQNITSISNPISKHLYQQKFQPVPAYH
jgi:hypothetical protein